MNPQQIPTAEPFFFKGDEIGFLLIHGFTGTPKEMRLLGEDLHTHGHTVLGVRLAGHATRIEDMRRTTWQDWFASVEDGYHMLRSCCDHVFSIGLSMGGALSMLAAAVLPLDAAVAISAPFQLDDWRLPFLRPLSIIKPFMAKGKSDMKDEEQNAQHAHYHAYPTRSIVQLDELLKMVRANAGSIDIPVLLIHSKSDKGVPFKNLNRYDKNLTTKIKKKLILKKSGHVVTEDIERDLAFSAIRDFAREVLH